MTDLDTLIGRVLGGRYRIEALLGRGGFGAVFRATHLELARPVAIKVLTARAREGDALLARFRREARLQADLRHPAIARLLDFGRADDDLCYMVQEYIDGQTLRALAPTSHPLPPERALRLVIAVLDGLAAAHLQGIVHRDLKPANIMVVDGPAGEEVRILDFGIAKARDALDETQTLTATGQILGTPAFMAPEQIEQRPITPATDLYAMGCVLYRLLTGERPFTGQLRGVLTAHLVRPVPALPPGLPPALSEVVARAMAKEATDRYPNATQMSAALRNILRDLEDGVARIAVAAPCMPEALIPAAHKLATPTRSRHTYSDGLDWRDASDLISASPELRAGRAFDGPLTAPPHRVRGAATSAGDALDDTAVTPSTASYEWRGTLADTPEISGLPAQSSPSSTGWSAYRLVPAALVAGLALIAVGAFFWPGARPPSNLEATADGGPAVLRIGQSQESPNDSQPDESTIDSLAVSTTDLSPPGPTGMVSSVSTGPDLPDPEPKHDHSTSNRSNVRDTEPPSPSPRTTQSTDPNRRITKPSTVKSADPIKPSPATRRPATRRPRPSLHKPTREPSPQPTLSPEAMALRQEALHDLFRAALTRCDWSAARTLINRAGKLDPSYDLAPWHERLNTAYVLADCPPANIENP